MHSFALFCNSMFMPSGTWPQARSPLYKATARAHAAQVLADRFTWHGSPQVPTACKPMGQRGRNHHLSDVGKTLRDGPKGPALRAKPTHRPNTSTDGSTHHRRYPQITAQKHSPEHRTLSSNSVTDSQLSKAQRGSAASANPGRPAL